MQLKYSQIFGILFWLTLIMIFDAISQSNSTESYIIYLFSIFNIPVFLGLVGALRPYQQYLEVKGNEWLRRWGKFILYYFLMILLFTMIINFQFIRNVGVQYYMNEYFMIDINDRLMDPYFRLSILLIVPVFEVFTYMFSRLKVSMKNYMITSIVISALAFLILISPIGINHVPFNLYRLIVESTLRIYHLIFFSVGVFLASNKLFIKKSDVKKLAALSGILMFLSSIFFFIEFNERVVLSINIWQFIQSVSHFLTSFFLLLTLFYTAKHYIIFKNSYALLLGKYSLSIIAWYGLSIVLSFNLAYQDLMQNQYGRFYVLSILILIIIGLCHFFFEGSKTKKIFTIEL